MIRGASLGDGGKCDRSIVGIIQSFLAFHECLSRMAFIMSPSHVSSFLFSINFLSDLYQPCFNSQERGGQVSVRSDGCLEICCISFWKVKGPFINLYKIGSWSDWSVFSFERTECQFCSCFVVQALRKY